MTPMYRAVSVAALLALAGCGANQTSSFNQGPILGATPAPVDESALPPTATPDTTTPAPATVVAAGVQNIDLTSFVDAGALKQMSDTSKGEASSAQYYQLQFGRVGAARAWTGDSGMTGQVNVGPYVKVNNRDCRDFTNVVNIGSRSFTHRGTACREDDGHWAVGSAAAASAPAAPAPTAGAT